MKTRVWAMGWMLLWGSAGWAGAAEWFVATNGNDAAAGTSWATAKLTIQAGVDAASGGDMVWVSNGVYATGGRRVLSLLPTNRVVIDKGIAVRSVNGPAWTVIQGARDLSTTNGLGDAAVRCVHVGNNANTVLSGFTLRGGATRTTNAPSIPPRSGGGVAGEYPLSPSIVENCILVDNIALTGGGAISCILKNCLIVSNAASGSGGGAYHCTLYNCGLTANSGQTGGGASNCTSYNSIVYGNIAFSSSASNQFACTLSYSCTAPLASGTGNIKENPLFLNAAAGDYRLALGSPCIDAGDNSAVSSALDLDGNPRIVDGDVDMGAYEDQVGVGVFLIVSPTNKNLDFPAASGLALGVTANVAWTAATNVPWLAIASGESGTTNGTVVFDVAANAGAARTGAVIVAGGGLSRTCAVAQAAFVPALEVSPASTNVGCGAASGRTLDVTANVAWTATTNAPWLAIASGADGEGNGTVVFGVADNPIGGAARTGTIVVAGSGLARTCTVVQAAFVPALAVSPASTNVGCEATSGLTLGVTANIAWTAATNAPWLAIASGEVGTTNGSISFDVSENATMSARTGAIIVTGSGLSRTCTVVQAGIPFVLEVDPSSTNVPAEGTDGATLAVAANIAWMAATNAAWLAITSGASGTTNGSVAFTVASNLVATWRTGAVVVAGGGLSRTCRVVQAPGFLVPTNWYVATNGNDTADGASWPTAKRTVQAAIDLAEDGHVVWVGPGDYTGGLVITNGIRLASTNGPHATTIRGTGGRCIALHHGLAVVVGFTVTGGRGESGAGVSLFDGAMVENCIITNNGIYVETMDEWWITAYGGGLFGGQARNCLIVSNFLYVLNRRSTGEADAYGAGAYGTRLENCTVASNSAYAYGPIGSSASALNGCELFNTLVSEKDPCYPAAGSPVPVFMPGDFHLDVVSPGIDAGTNEEWMADATDLDGAPRVLNGTVDFGCYETARSAALAPPTVDAPIAIPSGSNGLFRSTNDLIWVQGTKSGDCLVVMSTAPTNRYTTNGMYQTPEGTTWSNLVPRIWTPPTEIRNWLFRCASTNEATLGTADTILRGTAVGFGGLPEIRIDPPTSTNCFARDTQYALSGDRNFNTLEHMWVSNRANGASASFDAALYPASNWVASSVPLEMGTNVLQVFGTNMLGDVAMAEFEFFRTSFGSIRSYSNGNIRLEWTMPTDPAGQYQWQRSTNLLEGAWDAIGVPIAATQEVESLIETNPAIPAFFRMIRTGE